MFIGQIEQEILEDGSWYYWMQTYSDCHSLTDDEVEDEQEIAPVLPSSAVVMQHYRLVGLVARAISILSNRMSYDHLNNSNMAMAKKILFGVRFKQF